MRALAALVLLLALPAQAATRTTVAVAPFVTTAAPEYQWIGPAMAAALSMRVAQQKELNAVMPRQVSAAQKSDNLDPLGTYDDKTAAKLGRLLGADLVLVGSYEAAWPTVTLALKAIDPFTGKVVLTQSVAGELDKLIALEARAATLLAQALGAAAPKVEPGAFGTESVPAWRKTALALSVLDWQSLGPAAAAPGSELSLTPAALTQAKADALEATELDQNYGEAWAALGMAQALLGDSKEAWRSLGKATALGFGHQPTAVVAASFTRMREGRYEEAMQILRAAIERSPGFLQARGYLGELYNHRGQFREALAVFEEYAKVAPRQPWVLAQRGYTKGRLNDDRGAVADTIAAADLAPESPSMLIQLASRYIDAKKLVGAEDALLQALKLFPDETRAYVRLGYVYLLDGKDDLAIPVSEKALVASQLRNTGKDRAYAHVNLARAYGHKGQLDKAFEHLAAAKKAGARSLREVAEDPKLEGLRKDPRFAPYAD